MAAPILRVTTNLAGLASGPGQPATPADIIAKRGDIGTTCFFTIAGLTDSIADAKFVVTTLGAAHPKFVADLGASPSSYKFVATDLNTAGTYSAELHLTLASGVRLTAPSAGPLTFIVLAPLSES